MSRRTGTHTGRAAAAATALLALGLAVAPARAAAPADGPGQAADRVIVRYRPGVDPRERARLRESVDARSSRALALSRTEVVRLPAGHSVAAAVRRLRALPGVQFAQPDFSHRLEGVPDDPLFGQQWSLRNTGQLIRGSGGTPGADIGAPEAWDVTTGDGSLVVAVIDSGVNVGHPDIAPNLFTNPGEIPDNGIDDDGNGKIDDVHGWDFVNDSANVSDDVDEHGTLVASVIGARGDNAIGTSGVIQRVKILPLQVRNPDGTLSTSAIVDAVAYARDMGARVVNMSFGYFDAATDTADRDAIRAAPGVLFSTSAGNYRTGTTVNDNDTLAHWPSQLTVTEPNVIATANTTNQDKLSSSSSYGHASVDLGAPGESIPGAALASVFSEDFDGVSSGLPDGWSTNGSWAATGEVAVSAPNSLSDSPGGDYAARSDTWAQSPSFAVSPGATCYAENARRRSTQNGGDVFTTEYSLDGGPWTVIDSRTGTTIGFFSAAPGFATGSATSARVRFRIVANADATTADGVHVDDLDVRCSGGEGYQTATGTSFASPQTAGAAALLLAADPSLVAARLKSILRATVEPLADLAAKTSAGGRLDLARAVHSLVAPEASTEAADGVTGTAAVLRGTVTPHGSPTLYHFDYRRMGTSEWTSTADSPAGEGGPAPVQAAVGGLEPASAYEYRLVAAKSLRAAQSDVATFRTADTPPSSAGSQASGSRDTVAPAISGLVVTPARFRPLRSPVAFLSRTRRGATIRFRVSERAAARVRVLRPSAGRRVAGACVKPTRANRRARSCRRMLSLATVSLGTVQGTVRRRFSGRVRRRGLRPGSYALEVTASDAAGNRSRRARANFRIARL